MLKSQLKDLMKWRSLTLGKEKEHAMMEMSRDSQEEGIQSTNRNITQRWKNRKHSYSPTGQ
jgi:hypothetical protein